MKTYTAFNTRYKYLNIVRCLSIQDPVIANKLCIYLRLSVTDTRFTMNLQ